MNSATLTPHRTAALAQSLGIRIHGKKEITAPYSPEMEKSIIRTAQRIARKTEIIMLAKKGYEEHKAGKTTSIEDFGKEMGWL